MLQHSASAVYLPSRPRDSSLGPRTFSTTNIGGDPSCKTAHGVPLQASLTSSSSTRLGLSDEETCSRSDASSCRNALMHRASSFLASRRGSSEGFEDALESLDPPQPSADLNNGYSSFGFILKAPQPDTPVSQTGSPARASSQRAHAEVQRATPNDDARKTALGCNSTSMPTRSGRNTESKAEKASARETRTAIRERPLASPRPYPDLNANKSQGKEKQQGGAFIAATAAAESVNANKYCGEASTKAAAASEGQEGLADSSGSHKSSSTSTTTSKRTEAGGAPFPRAASQEARRVEVPRRAIGRYSSVPAFSVADRVRIDRFKEGLPECLSTQEAIKKQQRAAEEERIRRREAGMPSAVGLSSLECSTGLGEAVDWRSLLDAAGLGDVREDEITLEAEELNAKLQEFAPRAGPSWCVALLGCLWEWRM